MVYVTFNGMSETTARFTEMFTGVGKQGTKVDVYYSIPMTISIARGLHGIDSSLHEGRTSTSIVEMEKG